MNALNDNDMTRREFLKSAGTAAAGVGTVSALARAAVLGQIAPPAKVARPNILLISTDEQFAGAMSCAGCTDLKTPAMDSLAASGVRFSQAYCPFPLCTPSRASMVTGKMPHEIPVEHNSMALPEAARAEGIGNLLSAAGYDCQWAGKWHLPNYNLERGHGFTRLSSYKDVEVTPAVMDYLAGRHDRPFFLVAQYLDPHSICGYAGHRNLQRLECGPLDMTIPEALPKLPANFGVPPREPGAIRQFQSAGGYSTAGYTAEMWQRYRWVYYRLVERVDAYIAQVLGSMRRAGLEENTVVIFSSDHGDGLGAHGWNQKTVLYEESARIPLIVSQKGTTPAGRVSDQLVCNGPDLFATVCDYAGVDLPKGLRGRSVRPIAEGKAVQDWPDQVVVETLFGSKPGRAVRTRRFKYMAYSDGHNREMLVDLTNDPGEMFNLVGNREYQETLDDHRTRLARWCRQTRDAFPCVRPGTVVDHFGRPASQAADSPTTQP